MAKAMAQITWNGAAASYSIKPHGKFQRGKTRTTNDEALIAYAKSVRGFSVYVPEPRPAAKTEAETEPAGDEGGGESTKPEATDKGKGGKGGKGSGPRRGR